MAKKNQQGGLVLKKKTKDNYSLKGNANDSKVSVGPDFVGAGYTAYNWKSPAWGGQFQMGGSMPGAVGFMYARTQNPAPANGKYTKKTLASAQNGQEMKYYQDGLDFRPKSISQNGSRLNKDLFDLNTQAAQDATRNVIPRKMTAKEKKEAEAAGNAARQKSAEKRQAIVDERMRNKKSKGDLNTPGSWHTEDKFRLFPESVGGLGEIVDDYINPGVVVGGMTDLLGESIANRNPVGAATALGLSAGLGALGIDPLGDALKYKNVGSNYLKGLRAQGHQVQGANMFGDLADEFARYMGRGEESEASRAMNEMRRAQEAGLTRRAQSSDYIPYQPPTDAELAAMNQAEANRYFRRPSQTQTVPAPDPIEEYYQRNPRPANSGRYNFDLARQPYSVPETPIGNPDPEEYVFFNEGREIGRSTDPDARVEDFMDDDELRRFQTRFIPTPSPETQELVFGKKDFKIGQGLRDNTYRDVEGNTFGQYVNDRGDHILGDYKISDPEGGYMKINTFKDKVNPDAPLEVTNMTFKNDEDASAAKQFSKLMSHMPAKVDMGHISTSMYSQPLMNQQVARWANNNPGRITLDNVGLETLNPWHKGMDTPLHPEKGYPKHGDYLEQVKKQFPKLKKTVKSMSDATGYQLPEPHMEFFDMDLDIPQRRPITMEELNSPEFKEKLRNNPNLGRKVTLKAPTYTLKKHYKYGGHYIDSMGQWSHPGDITTIPSNDITMRGVNYDVMGVSNTGDKKLMKPGKNYKFDGDYVTEYPRGGWLEKYK